MKHILLLFIFLISISVSAQENRSYEKFINPNDSILFENLPRLNIPDSYKNGKAKDLPYAHSNAENGYFRPIFSQYGWSCGQASAIGYTFTYELNRVRNFSSLEEQNQYPPLHNFNFFNKGEDGVGVCYLYSFDAIKHNGQPNVIDYGGMGESLTYWPNGYETYYNGMFNRVEEVYAIDVDDEEGLTTLKHYLYDHLDGSEVGGIVNFYTDLGSFTTLPAGTPEEGKFVITSFGQYTGHAMTFLGWNDSIRYDFNGDGAYTNDVDINEDGIISLKDWEIGGLLLANSWGDDWADSGFCYVMYNVIAQEKMDGGIWNKQVNAIKVKEEYEPKITFKVELTHDSRNKIRVIAGVASDTNKSFPEHSLEFPIFSYQGGDNYMRGTNSNSFFKTLEFGLDVTPLLSHIEPGEAARFFLQVIEDDPNHAATGMIDYLALMDYTNGGIEIASPDSLIPLNENDITFVSLIHNPSWDNVKINNEELPAFEPGQSYTHQMTASGGAEPYRWDIAPGYSHVEYQNDYPEVQGDDVTPINSQSGFVAIPLEFDFPFYDRLCDTAFMYVDGFICFDSINYPYPYATNDMVLFKNEQMLSAFYNGDIFITTNPYYGMWYEGDNTYASFRWVATIVIDGIQCPIDFTATLYPDGEIDIFINNYVFVQNYGVITGLSNGDNKNFILSGEPMGSVLWSPLKNNFSPLNYPCDSEIDNNGLLSVNPIDEDKIYNIAVRVTDSDNVSDVKSYKVSSGLIYEYNINSGDDDQIDYGESPSLSFDLKNLGITLLTDVELLVETDDPFIQLTDDHEFAGSISSGNTINLADAISFELLQGIPNNYPFSLNVILSSSEYTWNGRINLTAYAPEIFMGTPIIVDGNNGRLEPGEAAQLIIPVTNMGFSTAEGVEGNIFTTDTLVILDPLDGYVEFGHIAHGATVYDTLSIIASEDAPQGHEIKFDANIQVLPNIELADSFDLLIGRYPVFIADLDPEFLSGPYIKMALEELDIIHTYAMYLPNELEDYQNIFVVLGRQFGEHVLTDSEGQRLADFLNDGGNVYMEGGMTWYEDPPTAVHPMFQIVPEYINWNQMDSVFGMEGTFLDNLHYQYQGDAMYYNYHLLPSATSYVILHSPLDSYNYAIAYAGEGYKTIGSTLDFGAFVNGQNSNTRNYLMGKMLEFFDVDIIITGMKDQEDPNSNVSDLSCWPNPIKDMINVGFSMTKGETVSIDLYNMRGDRVINIVDQEYHMPGQQNVSGFAGNLMPGVYVLTLRSDSSVKSIKVVVSN